MNRKPLSVRQIQYRRKVHAKGRRHFILYAGLLRFGGLWFVSMIVWKWHDRFNWHIPPATPDLLLDTLVLLLVSIAIGYFYGKLMWDSIYSKQQ
jgi:hypothetical protein